MILFIDDERKYVKMYIEELELSGFEVIYINNVEDALTFINSEKSRRIELLVLDVMMPFKEDFAEEETKVGIVLYKRFREKFSETPVCVLTNVSREDVREFFEKQENCYFNRKDDMMPVEFSQRIRHLLQKAGV